MNRERKICLPGVKFLSAAVFMVLLSLIRGVSSPSEIGAAMEAPVAFLAVVFCADTYLSEYYGNRVEVFKLYGLRRRSAAIYRRMAIQSVCLWLLSAAGFGLFYVQCPMSGIKAGTFFFDFGLFLAAIAGTILFWGSLSMTLGNLCRSIWAGIGGTLLFWLVFVSPAGNRFFGRWNVFAYMFRNPGLSGDWNWLCGKMASAVAGILLLSLLPIILKKRG